MFNPLDKGFLSKPKPPDRQARLESWLALHQITRADIARAIGVSKQMVGQILSGQKTPPFRIKQMIALGIPEKLLPGAGED